ncbi:hypothetical protein JCM12298_20150 [Desulfothermus naphthae]
MKRVRVLFYVFFVLVFCSTGIASASGSTGLLKWKFKTQGGIVSSPAIEEDRSIYIGSEDNYLYAINSDGTLKWSFETKDEIVSSPAIGKDGTIYIGSFDHYLYAIYSDSKGLAKSFWPMFRHDVRLQD